VKTNAVLLANARDACKSGAARMIRLSAGLTLEEVGREVGAAVSTVWRWENGERRPVGPPALRYARMLNDLVARHEPRRRRRKGVSDEMNERQPRDAATARTTY
jgi:transcriptional regulator with XRE-family HTH domain